MKTQYEFRNKALEAAKAEKNECKKIPSLVFEYDTWGFLGIGSNYKLFADGTFVKNEYHVSFSKPVKFDGPGVSVAVDPKVLAEIKTIINENKEALRSLPKDLSNHLICDGGYDTVRFGRLKFHGDNMFAFPVEKFMSKKKSQEEIEFEQNLCKFHELGLLQKIFFKVRDLLNPYFEDVNNE